jgi:hypothetical protein
VAQDEDKNDETEVGNLHPHRKKLTEGVIAVRAANRDCRNDERKYDNCEIEEL